MKSKIYVLLLENRIDKGVFILGWVVVFLFEFSFMMEENE